MTTVQTNTLNKLSNGCTIVTDHKNKNGIKEATLNALCKIGKISIERISAAHLSGSAKAYKIIVL